MILRQCQLENLTAPQTDGEQIIEIVRDSARQPSNRFHFLRLTQLLFELSSRRFRIETFRHVSAGDGEEPPAFRFNL